MDIFSDIETHAHTNRCWWNFEQARWECRPARADLAPEVETVDVRELELV